MVQSIYHGMIPLLPRQREENKMVTQALFSGLQAYQDPENHPLRMQFQNQCLTFKFDKYSLEQCLAQVMTYLEEEQLI
jgi:hypothetical protein